MTRSRRRDILVLLIGVLAAVGTWQIGKSGLILAKAWLAPILIERAWTRAEAGETGDQLKPWPWADTVPVARLRFPSLNSDRIALSGATGRAMAFGPTLSLGSPLPAFFGHRDTHFRVLGDLAVGDPVIWEHADGRHQRYQVLETAIMDKDNIRVPAVENDEMIALVTCWPFDAVEAGGPLRYVVLAAKSSSL